jgi:hypothetical protein
VRPAAEQPDRDLNDLFSVGGMFDGSSTNRSILPDRKYRSAGEALTVRNLIRLCGLSLTRQFGDEGRWNALGDALPRALTWHTTWTQWRRSGLGGADRTVSPPQLLIVPTSPEPTPQAV